ncbi:HAD family hydrolase [Azospirillum sp.]|uniref:HAD family hydrolase n=1 Tax=Azospirillum sp. TaxID=34012 RepID=UPI003D7274C5
MHYTALAIDYDGTLADAGRVSPKALDALNRLKGAGFTLVLVTGRTLESLRAAFPEMALFDRIVAENGAVVHRPDTGDSTLLGSPPPAAAIEALRRKGIPLEVGQVIVASRTPHEKAVVDTFRELALDNAVEFNKGAVMVLPAEMTKATGLQLALDELQLEPSKVIGIGDTENDHTFLALCGASVAVADAIPSVREDADLVTQGGAGDGVVELADHLIAGDLQALARRQRAHAPLTASGLRPTRSS